MNSENCKIPNTCLLKGVCLWDKEFGSGCQTEREKDFKSFQEELLENVKPYVSKKETVGEYTAEMRKTPIKVLIKRKEIPVQPLPITIDNFFVATKGMFQELGEVPFGFKEFFKSKGSAYWTNEEQTHLIRISDHWGYSIRFCSWHLKGYKKLVSFKWKKEHGKQNRIGIIPFSELEVNNMFTPSKKQLESRHPF